MLRNYKEDQQSRSSEEEVFYPSNEDFRDEIDRVFETGESTSTTVPCCRCCGLAVNHDTTHHDCVTELRHVLEKQTDEMRHMESKLQDMSLSPYALLRRDFRRQFSALRRTLACFDEKLDSILRMVSTMRNNPNRDRRCRGYCSKHVRTDKCLCRGLKEPHRCCGRIGGVCDC